MISDVLAEAAQEIRAYQADMPNSYEGLRHWINGVVIAMDELREYLDVFDPSNVPTPMRHELEKFVPTLKRPSGICVSPLPNWIVECGECGRTWQPILLDEGKLPDDWRQCPFGCHLSEDK